MNLRNKNEILKAVCKAFSVTEEQLCNTNRRVFSLTNARMAFIQLLSTRIGMSCIDMANLISRDRRSVHRLLNQHILTYRTDNDYKDKFDTLTGNKKMFECVMTVSETFPNKLKRRGYDGIARRKHMLKKMFDKLVGDGMVTVDATVDQDYNNTYITKLNIPKSWLLEQNL